MKHISYLFDLIYLALLTICYFIMSIGVFIWAMIKNLFRKQTLIMNYLVLQGEVEELLEGSNLSINPKLRGQARACAALIEEIIQNKLAYKFLPAATAKAMGDMSYECDGDTYLIDIKAHCRGKWGMPNLTSYKKLRDFYKKASNHFIVMAIDYSVDNDGSFTFLKVVVEPIEHFDWGCLAVQGTLGQIQIKNAEDIVIDKAASRNNWIKEFYETTTNAITKKQISLQKELSLFEWASSSIGQSIGLLNRGLWVRVPPSLPYTK